MKDQFDCFSVYSAPIHSVDVEIDILDQDNICIMQLYIL